MITCERYHDFSAGHRVVGHEGKCAQLHGHNYRVTFTARAKGQGLDGVGRVVDFSEIKAALCQWVEDFWDHRMLINEADPVLPYLLEIPGNGVVIVPFNPTAENMADYLLRTVAPIELTGRDVEVVKVRVEETRKCSAEAQL